MGFDGHFERTVPISTPPIDLIVEPLDVAQPCEKATIAW